MENKKFRLVITALTPEPEDYFGKTGGSVRLVEILRKFGDAPEIKIVAVATNRIAEHFKENGISADFRVVKSESKFKSLWGLCFKSFLIITKSFFLLKYDFLKSKDEKIIVYSSSDLFWEVIPAFFFKAKNKSVKWAQVIHHAYPDWKSRPGYLVVNFFGYYLQKFSFWLIRKRADRIIVVNSLVRRELIRLGFSEDRIFVSSNGIDLKYFEKIEGAEVSYDGVFLGRLSHSKGIFDLLEIWKKVCDEFPRARLAIIGGGSEETKNILSKKISNCGLKENIDLLGFLENKKAYPILKSGKVFLFPSHEEGWGIAVAEAMACGLPVVSWDLPVYKEIFDDRTTQIKENDIDLFSNKILELLKNDAMRKKVGEDGKEFIKKYSWDSVAKKELKIISS